MSANPESIHLIPGELAKCITSNCRKTIDDRADDGNFVEHVNGLCQDCAAHEEALEESKRMLLDGNRETGLKVLNEMSETTWARLQKAFKAALDDSENEVPVAMRVESVNEMLVEQVIRSKDMGKTVSQIINEAA